VVLIVYSDTIAKSNAVAFAIFEEVGNQFFFTRTAELHFVYVHPKLFSLPRLVV